MITFPTQYLVCEGPDLAGKSTLIRGVHKASGFRWNIQDRSFLSMLVYAKMYGRDTGLHARGLWNELTNLNNRFVLMLPTYEAVLERYMVRGDEIQDELTLEKVVDFFGEHDWLTNFPNVTLLDNSEVGLSALEDDVDRVVGWLKTKEEYSVDDIAGEVLRFVSVMPNGSPDDMRGYESQISFTFYDDGAFDEGGQTTKEIFADEEEGAYYQGIYDQFTDKICDELAGDNPYGEKQTEKSRRFVYTDDSCISFIQILIRDGIMDFHTVLRSTNVAKTFRKDLNFLYWLAGQVQRVYPELSNVRSTRFRVQLNSAHLVR